MTNRREDWLRIVTADDWDGRGSAPSTEHAINTARTLVGIPLGNGGFQIELHAGGADIEIEIGPDGRINSVLFLSEDEK